MNADRSLIVELEDAIESGSKDKRLDTLRRITDLFVSDADRFNDQQIDVFDDVLGHLIKRIEGKALAELSQRLGPINNAPTEIVRRLARDDDIAVAEPILTQSARLNDKDLIEIAITKTPAHLLAISGRSQIGANVTDVLLQRGDSKVFHKLAGNAGANFSEGGFATLVKHSERDGELAEKVGLRIDVPLRLFRELLLRATEAVRARLLALAGPEWREQIQRVLATISEDAGQEAGFRKEHDFAEAKSRILELKTKGELNGAIDNLLQSEHREALLVPCKAAALDWPTVRAILNCRSVGGTMSDQDVDTARTEYSKLSQSNAKRVLRFWQVRQTASKNGAVPAGSAPHALQRVN
jgi:uncharacterized protein (DUF2336 family)